MMMMLKKKKKKEKRKTKRGRPNNNKKKQKSDHGCGGRRTGFYRVFSRVLNSLGRVSAVGTGHHVT